MSKNFGDKISRRDAAPPPPPSPGLGGHGHNKLLLDEGGRPSVFDRLGVRHREHGNMSSSAYSPPDHHPPPPHHRHHHHDHHPSSSSSSRWPDSSAPMHPSSRGDVRSRIQDIPPSSSSRRSPLDYSSPPLPVGMKPHGHSRSHAKEKQQPGLLSSSKKVAKEQQELKQNKGGDKYAMGMKKEKKKKVVVPEGGKKKGLIDKRKKGKGLASSSVSSLDSSDDDDSISSSSTSSLSSSSSSNSSSSDSSVPSIKLKSAEPSKRKKRPKEKVSTKGKVSSSKPEKKSKKRAQPPPLDRPPSSKSSSSGGIDSHSTISTPSPMKKGPPDLREKLNARSPLGSGGSGGYHHQSKTMVDPSKRVKSYDLHGHGHSPMLEEDRYASGKKRPPPHDFPHSHYEDVKRRRASPSPGGTDKYRILPQDELHHRGSSRGLPPHSHSQQQMHSGGGPGGLSKRGPTPPDPYAKDPHQHRSIPSHSPVRRPDLRRPDREEYRDDRNRRDSPYPPHSQPHMVKPDFAKRGGELQGDFGRDNRPRDRLAPSRPPLDDRAERARIERNLPPQTDYQHHRHPPPPHQQQRPPPHYGGHGHHGQLQPEHGQGRPSGGPGGFRGGGASGPPPSGGRGKYEDERSRFPHEDKPQTLIAKSKEDLAERYGQMQVKKSGYVDRWVDETVRNTQQRTRTPLLATPQAYSKGPPSPLPFREKPSEPLVASKTQTPKTPLLPLPMKDKPISSSTTAPVPPVVAAEDLSDFSDDADELLNTVESPPSSVATPTEALKSTSTIVPAVSTSLTPEKESSSEQDKILTPTPLSTPIPKRSDSIDTAPSVPSHVASSAKIIVRGEGKSLSQSQQSDDDILDRMDFEEISDEELGGEVENKERIVDALGVDWASLVCQEKKTEAPSEDEADLIRPSARKRWQAANILPRMKISQNLVNETLYAKILQLNPQNAITEAGEESKTRGKDHGVLERIGLGPNSRALSSRRDLAVRRYLLDLPSKSILSLDLFHNNAPSININPPPPEVDSDLYKVGSGVAKPTTENSSKAVIA